MAGPVPEAALGRVRAARERRRPGFSPSLPARLERSTVEPAPGLSIDVLAERQRRDFPRVRSVLRSDAWRALMVAFLGEIEAAAFPLAAAPESFVAFLRHREASGIGPPWLPELAHHERVERALESADPPAVDVRRDGDLIDGVPLLALAVPLAYRWPVDLIGPGWIPGARPGTPTLLLARRDQRFRVRSGRVSRFEYTLLASLSTHRWTGRQHLIALARAIHGDPVQALILGHALLEQLRRDGIVAGSAAAR